MAQEIAGSEGRGKTTNYVHYSKIVVEENLARYGGGTDPHYVQQLMNTIRVEGQKDPVQAILKKADGEQVAHVTDGSHRIEAIKQLAEAGQHSGLVWLLVEGRAGAVNDEEAFKLRVITNHFRKSLTPLDYATQIKRWRSVFHKTTKEIAEIYSQKDAWVLEHERLLSLPAKIQKQLHDGKKTMYAALETARLDEQQQEKVYEETERRHAEREAKKAAQPAAATSSKSKKERPVMDRKSVRALAGKTPAVKRGVKELLSILEEVGADSEVGQALYAYLTNEPDMNSAALKTLLKQH